MRIAYAMLADAASVSEGKLYILGGGIEFIDADAFPAVQIGLTLILMILLDQTELSSDHSISVEAISPDGQNILPGLSFPLQKPNQQPEKPPKANIIIDASPIVFPSPGEYVFHIYIDGNEVSIITLTVRLKSGINP